MKNINIVCCKFFTYRQQEGQSFHDFVTGLKIRPEYEFDNLQDSLVNVMIACGTTDISLPGRLLQKCDLTLSKAISTCHAAEKTRQHTREILRSQPIADIDKVFKRKFNKFSHNTRNQNTRDFIKKCKFCDSSHPRSKCPAYVRVCNVCNEKNHFKVCCQSVGKRVH